MATKIKKKPVARGKPRPAARKASATKSRAGKAAKPKRRVPPRAHAPARSKAKRPQPKSRARMAIAKAKPARKRVVTAKPARTSAAPARPVKPHTAPKRPPLQLVPKPPANNNAAKGAIVKEKTAKEPILKIKQQAPAPKPREVLRPVPVPIKPTPPQLAPEPGSAFTTGDFVVYPTHGVGRVVAIETQEIAGIALPLIVINFDKDRMTLRVPVAKAHNSGLRKLSSRKVMDTALATLKGRSRSKRTMWSRRAQEYEAKINSGDPVSIAEVVRDLHRGADQPDQSYSERQIYQAALDRLARELAAVERIDERAAAQRLEEVLKAA